MIHHVPAKIKQNKPINTEFSILEISKAHMYHFHYKIRQLLNSIIQRHTSIKHYATTDVQFNRTTVDGQVQQTTAHSPGVLSDVDSIDFPGIAREFIASIENFNKRGSN